MDKKKLVLNGLGLGILLFIIAEFVAFVYRSLIMKLIPPGSAWSQTNEILASSTKVVYWVCRPFSHVIRAFSGDLITGLVKINIVNLVGWVILSVLILYFKNRKNIR